MAKYKCNKCGRESDDEIVAHGVVIIDFRKGNRTEECDGKMEETGTEDSKQEQEPIEASRDEWADMTEDKLRKIMRKPSHYGGKYKGKGHGEKRREV
jgi:DNA-directed RNA polymerase subunit RPC12/RpoP